MKTNKNIISAIFIGIVMSMSATAAPVHAADNTKSEAPVSDAWITTKVKTELAVAKGVESLNVSVETTNGKVTLTGHQPSQDAVDKAKDVAKSVKGVQEVDAAELKVSGDQQSKDGHTSDQPVSDTWITTKVKAELATTKGVESLNVSVETTNGKVTLSGHQSSQDAVDKAKAAAESIKGVQEVNAAELKVSEDQQDKEDNASDQPVSDTWITTKVKGKLATIDGVKARKIKVSTQDGTVTLTGVVPSDGALDAAKEAAKSIKGVQDVNTDGLKVK